MPNVIDVALDCIARDAGLDTIEACAKIAETHFKNGAGAFVQGYNESARDIALKIRKLKYARSD